MCSMKDNIVFGGNPYISPIMNEKSLGSVILKALKKRGNDVLYVNANNSYN